MYIIPDVAIPYPAAGKFVEYLDEGFGDYPLWLCPLPSTGVSPMSPRTRTTDSDEEGTGDGKMLQNFGVWRPGPKGRSAFVEFNRSLERKVADLGGKKWLYAHAYYTEEEFWNIHNRESYDALRKK